MLAEMVAEKGIVVINNYKYDCIKRAVKSNRTRDVMVA